MILPLVLLPLTVLAQVRRYQKKNLFVLTFMVDIPGVTVPVIPTGLLQNEELIE